MTGQSGQSASTTTQSGPPPEVLQAYTNLNNAATNLTSQPIPQYNAPLVAGFTPDQQQAFSTVENAQGIGQPYINAAAQEFGQATTPLWPNLPQFGQDQIDKFSSPYTKNVTDALTKLYAQQNAQQQAQIQGNATSHGAYGGDREAVAQALAAQQENLAQAPTLAQVQQQGYQQALGEFNQQQQAQLSAEQANAWLNSQAGFGLAGLGTQAQSQALSGASSQLQTGALQQQLAQEQLNIPYEQYAQQIASPYQQLNYLAGITEGTGSLSGGQSSTTPPAPSTLGQIAGLGVAGLGAAGSFGAFGNGSNTGAGFGGGFFTDQGGNFGSAARGGRIGYDAGGGIGGMPSFGMGIPDPETDNLIPPPPKVQGPGMFAGSGTTTTTGGGGGSGGAGIGGDIIGAAAKFIPMLFAARGGRIGYDTGGGIGLPAVPTINFDKLITPGPAIKGSGPPAPPKPGTAPDSGLSQDLTALGKVNFGNKGSSSGASDDSGARMDYDVGGATPIQGLNPNAQAQYSQYSNMSQEQLEEMAVRMPPTTPQGQLIQRALQQKRMAPQPAPAAAPDASSGIGSGSGLGMGQPQQAQPSPGGTSHLADGGEPGYVTMDEIDPHPIVDHSGETVKIRYPSEGNKVLDLGLPSIKGIDHRMLAAGGSSGASPQQSTSFTAPNGVEIPLLGSSVFAGPGKQGNPTVNPGEGMGGWFNPLPLYRPPGTGIGPNGSVAFPTTPGAMSAFGIPGASGAAAPAAAAVAPDGITIPQILTDNGGGGKRGGNVSRFDDGGDVGTEASGEAAAYEPVHRPDYLTGMGGDVAGTSLPVLDIGPGLPADATPYEPKKPMVTGGTDILTDIHNRIQRASDEAAPKQPVTAASTYAPPFTPAKAEAAAEPAAVPTQTGIGAPDLRASDQVVARQSAVPAFDRGEAINIPESGGIGTEGGIGAAGNGLAPGFARDANGLLTRNGRPPDTYIGGVLPGGGAVPAWETKEPAPVFVGDSIAHGIQQAAKASGVTHDGWRPDQVLGAFTGADFKGAPVYISSGVSNDPSQIGLAGDQIKAAQAANAGPVYLYGVGTGVANYRGANERLAEIAAANGATFVPLKGTEGGRIHPVDYGANVPDGAQQAGGIGAGNQKYGPVASALVDEAKRQGVPESLVIKAAQVESAMGTNLGSRGNVLQLGPQEWAQVGGGNMGDLATQAKNGVAWLAKSRAEAQQALGREPQDWETYIVHQQGQAGGPALLKAPPGQSAIDTLAPVYGGNRAQAEQAIIQNGGSLGMTAQQFLENTKARFEGYGSRPNLGATLAQGRPGGGGIGGGGDPVISDAPPRGGIGSNGIGASQVNSAINRVSATAPRDAHGNTDWVRSPWFPVLAAGLGMLASKSPYPGVAIGEGGLQGIKAAETMVGQENRAEVAGIRAQHLNELADVRQTAAGNKVASDAANLQFKYDNLKRLQDAGNQSFELKQQIATASQQLNEAKLRLGEIESDRKRAADTAKSAKPVGGFDVDPDTGKTVYGTHTYDPDQGKYVFKPGAGVGHPTAATGELAVLQRMMDSPDGPKTLQEAMTLRAQAKASPQAKQRLDLAIEAEARNQAALEERAFSANPTNIGKPFNVQGAEQRHLQDLRGKMYGAAPAAQPAAPTAAPAATPAAPAPAAATPAPAPLAHPPVIQNGWRYEWQGNGYQPTAPAQ